MQLTSTSFEYNWKVFSISFDIKVSLDFAKQKQDGRFLCTSVAYTNKYNFPTRFCLLYSFQDTEIVLRVFFFRETPTNQLTNQKQKCNKSILRLWITSNKDGFNKPSGCDMMHLHFLVQTKYSTVRFLPFHSWCKQHLRLVHTYRHRTLARHGPIEVYTIS